MVTSQHWDQEMIAELEGTGGSGGTYQNKVTLGIKLARQPELLTSQLNVGTTKTVSERTQ
jgi:hypothetical protein